LAMAGVMVACGSEDKKEDKKADEKAKQEQVDKKESQPEVKKVDSVADKTNAYIQQLENVESQAEAEAILKEMMSWYEGLNEADKKVVDDIMNNL